MCDVRIACLFKKTGWRLPMRAMDVMTTPVITVDPETTVQDLAKLLSEKGISGVPVCEGGLLHRAETGTERRLQKRRSWWLDSLAAEEEAARDYVKAHGQRVRDIMSREVISVSETTDLAEVAMLLETRLIKRVPVIRDGKLVGIISRANLVRALATTSTAPAIVADADDRSIRDRLLQELRGQRWANVWAADIMVRDKVVHIWLSDDQPTAERDALRIAAENIAGVRRVEEHIVPAPVIPAF